LVEYSRGLNNFT